MTPDWLQALALADRRDLEQAFRAAVRRQGANTAADATMLVRFSFRTSGRRQMVEFLNTHKVQVRGYAEQILAEEKGRRP